jgi:hypothetical protein
VGLLFCGLAQVEIGSLFGFLKESTEGNPVKIKKNYIELGCGAPPHLRGKNGFDIDYYTKFF